MAKRLLKLRCTSSAQQLQAVRESLVQALDKAGCDVQEQARLVLAVNEACMNIIQHAYRGDPAGEMILEILNNDRELEFRLTDFAPTVDASMVRPRPLDEIRPGGLGTHFIREIMDEVEFTVPEGGAGNLLIMKKHKKSRESRDHAM